MSDELNMSVDVAEFAKQTIDKEFVMSDQACLILAVGDNTPETPTTLYVHASAQFKMHVVESLLKGVIRDNGDMPRALVATFVKMSVDGICRAALEDEPERSSDETN